MLARMACVPPQLNAEETSVHSCRRKQQKPAVDVGTVLVADGEATEPMQPGEA
jgi:heat shock protein HslJ